MSRNKNSSQSPSSTVPDESGWCLSWTGPCRGTGPRRAYRIIQKEGTWFITSKNNDVTFEVSAAQARSILRANPEHPAWLDNDDELVWVTWLVLANATVPGSIFADLDNEWRESCILRVKYVAPNKWEHSPPVAIDVLAATFAINKSAKRYRDAASTYFQRGMHGLAHHASEVKKLYYKLKDIGVVKAYTDRRLQYCGRHGRLALYRGEGYVFHSTLAPVEEPALVADDDQGALFVCAKPKGSAEARLIDARFTLCAIEVSTIDFHRLEVPRKYDIEYFG